MPGMYVVTSALFVSRARATFLSAEFGFFGVCVYTRTHTPRFSGHPSRAGDFVFVRIFSRPWRTSCENVGTVPLFSRTILFKLIKKILWPQFLRTANPTAQDSASV